MSRQGKIPQSFNSDLIINDEGVFTAIDNMIEAFAVLNAVRNKSSKITDFTCEYVNKSGAKDFKLPQEDILGRKLSELLPKLKNTEIYQTFCRVATSGNMQRIQTEYYEKIGKRTVEGTYDITINKTPAGIVLTWRDISAAVETEEKYRDNIVQLNDKNARLNRLNEVLRRNQRNLIEAQKLAHLGSFEINMKTGMPEFTDEASRILDIDTHEDRPNIDKLLERVHPDDLEYVKKILQDITETKSFIQAEFRMIMRDNSVKYIHTTNNPVLNEDGEVASVFGIMMDITERKLYEQRLEELLQGLERSNKELEQFAYVSSHDLQEPLRMISSYLALLSKNYQDVLDERARTYIDIAVDGAKRMANLIRDLLSYSRLTSRAMPFEATDLNVVVNEVINDLELVIEETNAKIIVNQLPVVKADPLQMKQLFQNLISNALKFRSEDHPSVEIRAQKKSKEWIFSVSDNGIGIEPDFYERIFEIFQRLHTIDEYPGTGIGLALCKKIVDHHNGRIWAESSRGQGTIFHFTLPAKL